MRAITTSYRYYKIASLALIVATGLVAMVLFVLPARAATKVSTSERIITVHDSGSEKGFATKESTLRQAFKQVGITINSNDITEPGLDEPLVASSYEVNIYRARTVAIKDGATTKRVITAYRTAKQITEQIGLKLSESDTATLSLSKDIVQDGAAEVLTIDWATPVNLTFYGKTISTSTRAKTVKQLLSEKRIIPTAEDTVVPAEGTPVTRGMSVQIWRNGKQTVTVDEDVAFTTRKVNDANRDMGYKEVQTAGVVGKKSVTYEIVMQNGVEVSRTAINSVVTTEPVEQVEVVGVKGKYTTPSENEQITWNFLISKGLTREQTAGIMGNLMQEHKFNTTGDGLAQWTGGRQLNLRLLYPETYMTIQSQLDFMWFELTGGYSRALNAVRASTTVEGAVQAFQNLYEGCGDCRESLRLQYAYNILASH